MRAQRLFSLGVLIVFLFVVSSCYNNESHNTIVRAGLLMNNYPDSALRLLEDSVFVDKLSERDYADWCLLLTQARDKNYIEHTTDSLIRKALDYYEYRRDTERLMLTYYYMGRVSQDMRDAVRAQNYYLKALEVGKTSTDLALRARICSNLGMLYTYQDAYDMALDYMKEGLGYLQQMGDTASQSVVLQDIGRTYWSLNLLDSAEYYYRQTLEYSLSHIHPSVVSELGSVLSSKKDYKEALSYIQLALQLNKDTTGNYSTCLSLGKLYFFMNRLDSAEYYLHKSLGSPAMRTRAGAYSHLYQIAKQQERWEIYALMQEKYEQLRDSIQVQNYTETIQRIQSLYDYQQVENKARQYHLQHAISQRNYYRTAFLGILLFLGLIGCVFYMSWRKNQWRVRERLLKQVIDLHKQDSDDQIHLNLQNIEELDAELKNALDTRRKLIESKKRMLELSNEQIKQGRKMQKLREEILIGSGIYIKAHNQNEPRPTESEKKMLKEAIDEAYPGFIRQIIQLYPQIDPYEVDLCYYTKINLSNKRMADIMSYQDNTIPSKKSRLYYKIFKNQGSPDLFNKFISSL